MSTPARRGKPSARERFVPVAVVLGVLVLAGVLTALIASGGGSDDLPAPGSPEQLALGEEVFTDSCQTCHGPGAAGGLAGPPLIHEIYEPSHHPDEAIRTAIAQGVQPHHWEYAGMPPIPGLDDTEVEAVIAYVRAQQREAWGGDTP